jgi:hypothetical protein
MEHVRSSPIDSSPVFRAMAGLAIAVPVMFALAIAVYNLFSRSVAGGLAAILALYIVGVCAKLTAREIARSS